MRIRRVGAFWNSTSAKSALILNFAVNPKLLSIWDEPIEKLSVSRP